MSEGSSPKEISLGDSFGEVAVKANGIRIELHADGSIDAYTAGPVKVHPAANDTAAKVKTAIEIGDLDDGGTYVGLSASSGKPLHAALADLPDYKTYEEALAAAEQLKSLHPTAHVPTPKELDKNLFDNRNTGHLKGTFNTSGSYPGSLYRSSESSAYFFHAAKVQGFYDGHQGIGDLVRDHRHSVRLVW